MVISNGFTRRSILAGSAVAGSLAALPRTAATAGRGVSVIADPADPVVASPPGQWVCAELISALTAAGATAHRFERLDQAPPNDLRILVSGPAGGVAADILRHAGVTPPAAVEAIALVPASESGRPVLVAFATDPRGLVFAVSELADRVRHGGDPSTALRIEQPVLERPATRIRSIGRCFESVTQDRAWFHDRAMWHDYLSMLASSRINRFALTFGVQYNYPMEVSDVYLYFAYPFLLSLPNYPVRVVGLPDEERDRNLATVRFIGEETTRRGIDFQIGLWTHGYKFDSPRANYLVEGIMPQNHAPYCRDALARLLREVPTISGVTFRVHGESGIPEGSYDFWQTVFSAITQCGRKVEIDMHAKGMDQKTIDLALATGMPVCVSPKYLAEHIGLPYQVSAIRDLEMPPKDGGTDTQFSLSQGSRKFTRYSYADFLAEDRRHGVIFRIWPGTQRVLLWGDPTFAAGYGRFSGFCGADGSELWEPLSFKGRMGSGRPGDRTGYADPALIPPYDWLKFAYTYRIWGRLTYNPETTSDVWRRYLDKTFGAGGIHAEAALAAASRILPLITLVHGPSVSNNSYWPEIYTNMSIVQDDPGRPYYDTPKPPRFGTADTFDSRIFARIDEHAQALLAAEPDARYSPVEVAHWLDDLAADARQHADALERDVPATPDMRRLVLDVRIQAAIAQFFAAKLRSGVLWAIFAQTRELAAAREAVQAYRHARDRWADAARIGQAYIADLSYGPEPWLRGHWQDRLPQIDADLTEMERLSSDTNGTIHGDRERIWAAVGQVLTTPVRDVFAANHAPPRSFKLGADVPLVLTGLPEEVCGGRLCYRHVNQAETWQSVALASKEAELAASIPASYTQSRFALQYYFELYSATSAALYPGLTRELANQPYFVVRQAT